MSSDIDAKNYFQRLANFSSPSVYKDMVHKAIAALDRIEALEGEVERLASALEGADQDVQERLLKAEARAERLRVALDSIAANADAASDLPLFRVQCRDFARKALEDDKPIRAAAGEEGK